MEDFIEENHPFRKYSVNKNILWTVCAESMVHGDHILFPEIQRICVQDHVNTREYFEFWTFDLS